MELKLVNTIYLPGRQCGIYAAKAQSRHLMARAYIVFLAIFHLASADHSKVGLQVADWRFGSPSLGFGVPECNDLALGIFSRGEESSPVNSPLLLPLCAAFAHASSSVVASCRKFNLWARQPIRRCGECRENPS